MGRYVFRLFVKLYNYSYSSLQRHLIQLNDTWIRFGRIPTSIFPLVQISDSSSPFLPSRFLSSIPVVVAVDMP